MAEIAEPAIARFVASGADQVLRVVGDLRDADAELLEQLDMGELVLEGADVLKAEDDPGLAHALGQLDVGGAAHRHDQLVIVPQPALPLADVAHRPGKILPYRAGAVGRGQPASAHVFKDRAAPIRDDQAVDDDHCVVQGGHVGSARPVPVRSLWQTTAAWAIGVRLVLSATSRAIRVGLRAVGPIGGCAMGEADMARRDEGTPVRLVHRRILGSEPRGETPGRAVTR